MEPLPRVTVTRGWTFATPQTTTFGCGDVEQGNPTQNIFHKRQVNPYDQYCGPDATTTELTVVVHVPFITATTQIPYTGKTTSTSISLSDGGLTETTINYVPNSVCANTGSACGSISTSGSAVFGVQTACCQLGLRCATDSSNVICVYATLGTTVSTKYWTGKQTSTTSYTTYIDVLPYLETDVVIPIVTQTVTKTWASSFISTVTTITPGSTGGTATVVIDVPTKKIVLSTVTVTEGWASSFTSTVSTITPEDTEHGTYTVVVETPSSPSEVPSTSSITETWDRTYFTTYCPTFTPTDGSIGVATVKVPPAQYQNPALTTTPNLKSAINTNFQQITTMPEVTISVLEPSNVVSQSFLMASQVPKPSNIVSQSSFTASQVPNLASKSSKEILKLSSTGIQPPSTLGVMSQSGLSSETSESVLIGSKTTVSTYYGAPSVFIPPSVSSDYNNPTASISSYTGGTANKFNIPSIVIVVLGALICL